MCCGSGTVLDMPAPAASHLRLPRSSPLHAPPTRLPPTHATQHLAHPSAVAPAKQGPDVGWTTGILVPLVEQTNPEEPVRWGAQAKARLMPTD